MPDTARENDSQAHAPQVDNAQPTSSPASKRFARTELLAGATAMEKLAHARVAVFGVGGVGGFVIEALARSGVGTIDVIDNDTVSETNINRQLLATESTIGREKIDVARERILDINPNCAVRAHKCFYLPATKDQFDFSQYDYVVDAVDTVTAKLQIIQEAHDCHVPVISCMGAGNKFDPGKLKIADINETSVCPLAKVIRKECRKRGIPGFKVVYSTEPAHTPRPDPNDPATELPPEGRRSLPGSFAPVPATAGLMMAAEVLRDIAGI